MIKIDLKYYKNKNVDLLKDVLNKVEKDKCIKQDENSTQYTMYVFLWILLMRW